MLSGHTIGLLECSDSSQLLLHDPVSETDEAAEISRKVLYRASFEELADNHVQYDTIIWILISLLLVLAWGVGIIMLLYLPIRRYILQKDISSRKLYVTPGEIVYKVIRPSFLPFLGFANFEKRIPLHLVIDIIIEQGMLSGHTIGLLECSDSSQLLLHDPVSETDEAAEISRKVLYRASFEELADNHVQYDTIIWILISLLLVLAWGVGIIMLLYLPIRRYILQKDISSRKLYVTPGEIVYKVIRPSFLPFLGFAKFEKRIPLHLVIDIIIEQGCLQSHYGIHTFRVENIAYGKASPVDELQVQGVSDPELLRKVIISEAAKVIQEAGGWKPRTCMEEGESTPTRSRSLADVSPIARFHSPSGKMMASPRLEPGPVLHSDLLLHKLEEVKQSVKKIESLVEGSQAGSDER